MKSTSRKEGPNPKANVGKMTKGQNFSGKKVPYEASEEYLAKLAQMIINPSECSELVRSPADFAMTGDIKCFTRTFQLKASQLADQTNFSMTISPAISNFFSLSTDQQFNPGVPFRATSDGFAQAQAPGGNLFCSGTLELYPDLQPTDLPVNSVGSEEHAGKIGWQINAAAGEIVNIAIPESTPARFVIWFFDGVTNSWLNMGTYDAEAQVTYVPFTVPVGAFCAGIAIQCGRNAASSNIDMKFTAGWSVPQGVHLHKLYDSDAVLLGKVERYRVTALSALVSYSGDFLNNGGVIASARTQPHYSYNEVPYDALTRLQDHKCQGPLLEGQYVWWLPYSYEEMDYRTDLLAPSNATALRVAGQFANATGAVVVTVCCVVEFYSPLQIFSHEPGPYSSDAYLALLHALDRLPAATCNPEHTELFSKLWDKGISAAKSGVQFLMENPAILAKIAAMILA